MTPPTRFTPQALQEESERWAKGSADQAVISQLAAMLRQAAEDAAWLEELAEHRIVIERIERGGLRVTQGRWTDDR